MKKIILIYNLILLSSVCLAQTTPRYDQVSKASGQNGNKDSIFNIVRAEYLSTPKKTDSLTLCDSIMCARIAGVSGSGWKLNGNNLGPIVYPVFGVSDSNNDISFVTNNRVRFTFLMNGGGLLGNSFSGVQGFLDLNGFNGGGVVLTDDGNVGNKEVFSVAGGSISSSTPNGLINMLAGQSSIQISDNDPYGNMFRSGNNLYSFYNQPSGNMVVLNSSNVASTYTCNVPNKTGVQTMAMLSDISVTTTNTVTLTNKRITRRVTSVSNAASTLSINTDNQDLYAITSLSVAITFTTTTGTPLQGDLMEIQITDNGTARALTWNSIFAASTVALPTTTVISTLLHIYFEYDTGSSKWICIGTAGMQWYLILFLPAFVLTWFRNLFRRKE